MNQSHLKKYKNKLPFMKTIKKSALTILGLMISCASMAQVNAVATTRVNAGAGRSATVHSANSSAKAARVAAKSANTATNHGTTVRKTARVNGASHARANANANGQTHANKHSVFSDKTSATVEADASGSEKTTTRVKERPNASKAKAVKKTKEAKVKTKKVKTKKVKTKKEKLENGRSAGAHANAELKSSTKVKAEKK